MVSLDAISQSGGFDLAFYRQLVRNGLEQPAALRSIDVWHAAPLVYPRLLTLAAGQFA